MRLRLIAAVVGIVALVLLVHDVPLAGHLERVERVDTEEADVVGLGVDGRECGEFLGARRTGAVPEVDHERLTDKVGGGDFAAALFGECHVR